MLCLTDTSLYICNIYDFNSPQGLKSSAIPLRELQTLSSVSGGAEENHRNSRSCVIWYQIPDLKLRVWSAKQEFWRLYGDIRNKNRVRIQLPFLLTLNIPRGVLWGPQRLIFCDLAVTITTNLLLIFVCVAHQLKINIMQLDL